MRAWADQDVAASRVIRTAYEKRTKFVRSFCTRLGFRRLDAEIRTRLMLCCMSWQPSMYVDETETRRLKMLHIQHELLTKT